MLPAVATASDIRRPRDVARHALELARLIGVRDLLAVRRETRGGPGEQTLVEGLAQPLCAAQTGEHKSHPISTKTVLLGVLATAALHVAGFGSGGVLATAAGSLSVVGGVTWWMIPWFFIGVVQLAYVIPAWFVMRRRGWHGAALGLVIGASLTFLANTACFGLLVANGNH